jgi:hypothetical protein
VVLYLVQVRRKQTGPRPLREFPGNYHGKYASSSVGRELNKYTHMGRTPAFQPHTIARLTADAVIMDKRQTLRTSQSMAKRVRQVHLDEQSNPLFDSNPFSSTTIRKYSQQIAHVAEEGGVNTNARAAALVDLRNFISVQRRLRRAAF